MFPANALSYRLNYVSQGRPVITEERTLEELFQRKPPLITEGSGFDPNRDQGYKQEDSETKINPLVYLTGPVFANYEGDPKKSSIDPGLSQLISYDHSRIHSITNQLQWDYKNGICQLKTACSKGVCGFVGQQEQFDLEGVKISTQNDYASINIVSMDQKPINQSEKILIQTGTLYQPTDWQEKPAVYQKGDQQLQGFQILNTGKMPWQCVNTKVSVEITNSQIERAVLLNSALYAEEELKIEKLENRIKITLPENCMYVVLMAN